MRRKATLAVSIAFATCALLHPQSASAQNSTNVSMPDPNVSLSTAQREAALMVPAQATLDKAIDARKIQPGQQFQAKLTGTVYLKNGLELPRDTVLVGTIATDKMRAGGTSTLALRFTRAELKGGKVVPIQADIMEFLGRPAERTGRTLAARLLRCPGTAKPFASTNSAPSPGLICTAPLLPPIRGSLSRPRKTT